MSRASRATGPLFFFTSAAAVLGLVWGCKTTAATDKLCTADAYVYCRCEDRREGTKRCSSDGTKFAECSCGLTGQLPDLGGEPQFQPIKDATPDGGLVLPEKCAGKIAVIGSALTSDNAPDLIHTATYTGGGNWATTATTKERPGPALRGTPQGVLVGSSLVAIWPSKFQTVVWTKFESGQTSLLPPVQIADALSEGLPSLVGDGANAKLFYLGQDGVFRSASYSPTLGWDESTKPVPPGSVDVRGRSGPAAELVGKNHVLGFAGSGGALAIQSEGAGGWDAAVAIPGATAFTQAPAMLGLAAGNADLVLVYQGTDSVLRWTTRAKASGAWAAPALLDTAATSDGSPALAQMSDGRVMLVWRAIGGVPFYSVFAPADAKWMPPAAVSANVRLSSAPGVASSNCASLASTALVDDAGNVQLMLYDGTRWVGPYFVPEMSKITFAGTGEVP